MATPIKEIEELIANGKTEKALKKLVTLAKGALQIKISESF